MSKKVAQPAAIELGLEPLLTEEEVSDYLRVDDVGIVHRLATEGRIHSVKVGRHRRYPLSGIARFIHDSGSAKAEMTGVAASVTTSKVVQA
jgi:excisionase family DNA binding protein